MRTLLLIVLFTTIQNLSGQTTGEPPEGSITYITSQSVYVRFKTTDGIVPGDTLYFNPQDRAKPALIVRERSSTSCVCTPMTSVKLNVGDKIYGTARPVAIKTTEATPVAAEETPPIQVQPELTQNDSAAPQEVPSPVNSKQQITGYLSVSSYSGFSNTPAVNTQRFQYTLSFIGKGLGNTGLSAECYTSFYHKPDAWSEVQSNIFTALKIYNLNIGYTFAKNYTVLLGRKINPLISNAGAIDGLQFEMRFSPFTIGIFGGSRPDYRDYSFNFSLLQYGAYVAHTVQAKNGPVQSTLAFVQQNNSGQTDRRFIYLQHANSLIRNLTFFGSAEVDIYRNIPDTTDSTYSQSSSPKLSNLYLSLRWRIIRQLSVSLSYSSRTNVIYYETYKSYLDQLLEMETTQGYLFNVTYRPINKLTFGATVGYRFQKSDPRPSKNLNGYLTYSQIPGIGISATLTATLLETSYISGQVYGIGISRDLISGKLYAALNYRYTHYNFTGAEAKQIQNIGELNLTWRILRKLSCSVYFEGTFESVSNFQRLYVQITQRL